MQRWRCAVFSLGVVGFLATLLCRELVSWVGRDALFPRLVGLFVSPKCVRLKDSIKSMGLGGTRSSTPICKPGTLAITNLERLHIWVLINASSHG